VEGNRPPTRAEGGEGHRVKEPEAEGNLGVSVKVGTGEKGRRSLSRTKASAGQPKNSSTDGPEKPQQGGEKKKPGRRPDHGKGHEKEMNGRISRKEGSPTSCGGGITTGMKKKE